MLSERLRALMPAAAAAERFDRCEICDAKLRAGQSKLQFVADQVRRGKEANPLLLEMFSDTAAVAELSRPVWHRINSCCGFRKECTESMALLSELGAVRRRLDAWCGGEQTAGRRVRGSNGQRGDNDDDEGRAAADWSGWHVVDLCAGACLTGALVLQLLRGASVTAVASVCSTNQMCVLGVYISYF